MMGVSTHTTEDPHVSPSRVRRFLPALAAWLAVTLTFAPALAQFEQAVTYHPAFAEAHLGLARASHSLGDASRAEIRMMQMSHCWSALMRRSWPSLRSSARCAGCRFSSAKRFS